MTDAMLYETKAAKAAEFGVDERQMRLVGTYYMGHGHVVLRSKITCTEVGCYAVRAPLL